MNPDERVLAQELRMNDIDVEDIDGINLLALFQTMNCRIEILIDRNHLLGHALFLKVRTGDDIITVIQHKVIPLLEEYFFHDLQKIQLVFNDLTEDGLLRDDAVYCSETIAVDRYFDYSGDYVLEDKNHYFINPDLQARDLIHVYRNQS